MKRTWAQLYCTLSASILFFFIPGPVSSADDPLLIPMYHLLLGKGGPSIQLVKDIFPGIDDSEPEDLYAWNGLLFFEATDGVYGNEVWMSDGTASGTAMLKDINVGPDRSNGYGSFGWDRSFTGMDGFLYFAATDGNHPAALWKSDGTSEGTNEVYSVSPGNFIVFNGALYFTGTTGSGISADTELWKSDGTSEGTEMVKNISENFSSYAGSETGFTEFNNELYFGAANTSSNTPSEPCGLWKTDGTEGGTVAVKPGTDLEISGKPAVCNNALYFIAYDAVDGYEFWKSNGTDAGTVMLPEKNFAQTPTRFTEYNGQLYFVGDDGTFGMELWKLDCSTDTLTLVKDIYPGDHSSPQNLTLMEGILYFKAEDADHGLELWKTDGTESGTTLVKDINPGSAGSSIEALTAYDGMLYFTAYDGEHGDELWRSDGTEPGTELLKDINPGPDWSYPVDFTAVNRTLFFTATDATNGWELWKLKK